MNTNPAVTANIIQKLMLILNQIRLQRYNKFRIYASVCAFFSNKFHFPKQKNLHIPNICCIFGRRLGCANSPENTAAQLCE